MSWPNIVLSTRTLLKYLRWAEAAAAPGADPNLKPDVTPTTRQYSGLHDEDIPVMVAECPHSYGCFGIYVYAFHLGSTDPKSYQRPNPEAPLVHYRLLETSDAVCIQKGFRAPSSLNRLSKGLQTQSNTGNPFDKKPSEHIEPLNHYSKP